MQKVQIVLYIYVEDVDKHFDRARNAGATILEEPEDQFYGDRRYAAGQLKSSTNATGSLTQGTVP